MIAALVPITVAIARQDVGHTQRIVDARYSRDGKRVVTASEDGTARIWDAVTGAQLIVLKGHERSVDCAAFSPYGSMVATGSKDGTVRIWNVESGREIQRLGEVDRERFRAFKTVEFSPDGTAVLAADFSECKAVFWEARSGRIIREFQASSDAEDRDGSKEPFCLMAAFSPSGQQILTVHANYMAHVWSASSGKRLVSLRNCYSDRPFYSADGRRVMSVGDGVIVNWDAQSGRILSTWKVGRVGGTGAVSPDGRWLATSSGLFNTLALRRADTGELVRTFRREPNELAIYPRFSPDGRSLMVQTGGRSITVYDVATGRVVTKFGSASKVP